MIILIGESASGKSTIEKILADQYGYKKTVSYFVTRYSFFIY